MLLLCSSVVACNTLATLDFPAISLAPSLFLRWSANLVRAVIVYFVPSLSSSLVSNIIIMNLG